MITGIGDHLRPEWPITITGMRTNINILLEEVRGEAVPQRVWRHAVLDPRGLGSGSDGAAQLAG